MATSCGSAAGSTTALFKATGFDYGYTTREAVIRLGEHLRLAPVMRGAEQEYTYEREVEEFLRWSPHVRRERPGERAAWPPTASHSGSSRLADATRLATSVSSRYALTGALHSSGVQWDVGPR